MRLRAAGFYTEDLRMSGSREGFRIVTLDGNIALLASVGHPGPVHVSKYGVDISEFERVGVPSVRHALERGHVAVVDEIGRMQLFSKVFRRTIFEAIRSHHLMLGTIMQGRNPYADRIKSHPNVEVLSLTETNRKEVLQYLRDRFV